MKGKTIGLDIGTTSIKAAMLERSGDSIILESIAVSPSIPKGIMSESLSDQKNLADAIKKTLISANFTSSNVNISIPESQIYTKVIEMPELSEQELSAALKWEMEQYIPLPLDQVRTDWQILGKQERNGRITMSVMLVAAPYAILDKYEKILEIADLTVETIETEIISVHRSLLPLLSSSLPSMVVHIGGSMTNVAIVKNGIISTVFSIALGGLAVTRAISIDLGIDITQAENFKKAYGLKQDTFEGKIGKSLQPILESIIGDIRKAIMAYKEKNNNEEISQIVLSGGSALLPGIDIYFTNALGVQVILGNSWGVYNISNVPKEIMVDAPSYNVVVGLSLHDLI